MNRHVVERGAAILLVGLVLALGIEICMADTYRDCDKKCKQYYCWGWISGETRHCRKFDPFWRATDEWRCFACDPGSPQPLQITTNLYDAVDCCFECLVEDLDPQWQQEATGCEKEGDCYQNPNGMCQTYLVTYCGF
jgi:hypothetical protein